MLMDYRVLRLASANGFAEAVDENLSRYGTAEAAFNEANRLHEKYFGEPRYSGYDSYRVSRKKRREKAKNTKK